MICRVYQFWIRVKLPKLRNYLVHTAHDRILPSTYGEHSSSELVHSTEWKYISDGSVLAPVPGTASAFASTHMEDVRPCLLEFTRSPIIYP